MAIVHLPFSRDINKLQDFCSFIIIIILLSCKSQQGPNSLGDVNFFK